MDKLGDKQFFYSEKTDTFYKVVDIKGDFVSLFGFVVQECYLELFTTTQVGIDPENTKEYKYVEVYQIIPFGRKRQMSYKLFQQLITYNDFNQPIVLEMSDKWLYKDV